MSPQSNNYLSQDNDSPWKEVLEAFFEPFVAFFVPQVYTDINWQQGYQFLDKELQQIFPEADQGRRYVDKLVQVQRHNGQQTFVLIHIEVQAQRESLFAQRMFTYHYRLLDRYSQPVYSLAVLADNDPNWRPEGFQQQIWDCQLKLLFPSIKLLDYSPKWDQLEASDNPFATVVMAHLSSQQTAGDMHQRLETKLNLVRRLYRKGYTKLQVVQLFRFIDWLLHLPQQWEQGFKEQIYQWEEDNKVPYISSIERMGIEKGLEQGELLDKQKVLTRLLDRKYGLTEQEKQLIAEQEDAAILDKALDDILFASSKQEVLAGLRQAARSGV